MDRYVQLTALLPQRIFVGKEKPLEVEGVIQVQSINLAQLAVLQRPGLVPPLHPRFDCSDTGGGYLLMDPWILRLFAFPQHHVQDFRRCDAGQDSKAADVPEFDQHVRIGQENKRTNPSTRPQSCPR